MKYLTRFSLFENFTDKLFAEFKKNLACGKDVRDAGDGVQVL